MKAIFYYAIAFLFINSEVTNAQQYHPMLNNSTWIIKDYVSCCRPSQTKTIEAGTDLIVDGTTYKKFLDPFASNATVLLREDIEERKVYKLVGDDEVLLYDFSLENSDTFGGLTATVDYVIVNDESRKRIVLNGFSETYQIPLTQTWIEGVGSTAHPFKPDHNMWNELSASGGYRVNLLCSFQNGVHVYGNSDCLATATLSTNNADFQANQISFSPNPFRTELSIRSEIVLDQATVKVYNSIGQLVRELSNQSGKVLVLNRENLKSGVYFIQLYENGKLVKASKILVD
jgi:Secretion system C-terminal sorting domain